MPADPTRARAIARAAALIADPAERSAALDAACGGDPDLRALADELLRAGPSTATFGGPVPDGPTVGLPPSSPAVPPATLAGAVLAGRYTILNLLGEGGMGAVYLAEQTHPVRRRVALKMIKAGADSARVVARFEAERQALALLDHPHIAKVFDAGASPWGAPFFVMELAEGVPLTEFCDNLRLPVPDRLALFARVCSAVQHAHQKGILHRDLKPSNILVSAGEGVPEPKVIDFGLAKAVGPTPLAADPTATGLGTVLGTPLYMAPEQAGGDPHDVDTRADVYALGVILYELLTGTTPLDRRRVQAAVWSEVVRMVREEEPPAPSSRVGSAADAPTVAVNRKSEPSRLTRLVRGDLDWVVMKALAKDRGRRYDSAAALAEDVGRFLNHEAVSAGPPSRWYKARKFARRHRAAVAAAAAVGLALVAGVIGTTWGLVRALAAEQQARDEQGKTKAALETVSKEQARTKAALDAEVAQHGRTGNALRLVTADIVGHLLNRKANLTKSEGEFLRRALAMIEDHAKAAGSLDDRHRLHVLEEANRQIGQLALAIRDYAEAERRFREAIRLNEQLQTAGVDRRYMTAAARLNLGTAISNGDPKRGDEALAQVKLGLDLEAARAAESKTPEARADWGTALINYAEQLAAAGHNRDAAAQYRLAVQVFEPLVAGHAKHTGYRLELARAFARFSTPAEFIGELAEAEAAAGRAVALYRAAVPDVPDSPDERVRLAEAVTRLSRFRTGAAKLALLREAFDVSRKLTDDYPGSIELARWHAKMCFHMGESNYYAVPADAVEWLRDSNRAFRRVLARDPDDHESKLGFGLAGAVLGLSLEKVGKYDEAGRELRAAVECLAGLARETQHPRVLIGHAASRQFLGIFYLNRNRPAEALAEFDRSAAVLDSLRSVPDFAGPAAVQRQPLQDRRAEALARLGKHAEAAAALEDAVRLAAPADRRGLALRRLDLLAQAGAGDRFLTEGTALLADKATTPLEYFRVAAHATIAWKKSADAAVKDKLQRVSIRWTHRAWQLGYKEAVMREAVEALRGMKDHPDVAAFLAEYDRPSEVAPPPRPAK